MKRSRLVPLLLCVLIGLTACGRGGDTGSPSAAAKLSFTAVDITGAEYARNLNLNDADGKPFKLADHKGKLVLVFFGYTQCPDVCPTTMAELANVKKQLGAEGDKLLGVFVTVDPARDTPELLKAYVGSFGPGFMGLHGNEEQTKAAAREFKVFYGKAPGKTEGSYTVDHTAGTFVFDTQGRVRLFVRYGAPTEALVKDLKLLLANTG
jgi:protein SCO1